VATNRIGAGVLGLVEDFCSRKDWIQTAAPATYHEGQLLRIYSQDLANHLDTVMVMAVSMKFRRIYVTRLPSDLKIGDLLVVDGR
jgi:hypothetical protein